MEKATHINKVAKGTNREKPNKVVNTYTMGFSAKLGNITSLCNNVGTLTPSFA